MAQPQPKPDFNSIRAEIERINRQYGGRMNIEQWATSDGECLKVQLTWKVEKTASLRACYALG